MEQENIEQEETPIDKSVQVGLINLGKNAEIMQLLYKDAAQSSVKKVGAALGNVIGLVETITFPLWLLNKYTEHKRKIIEDNFERVRKKLDEIPEEKICEVPPEIGVPIVEKLTYVTNEQIREAYLNLLKKAASSDTALQAHPSFEGMIARLSTDEAKIIAHLNNKPFIAFINFKRNMETGGYQIIKKFATGIEFDIALDYPENINVYLDNLLVLGVLDYTPGIYKTDENLYNSILVKYNSFQKEQQQLYRVIKETLNNPIVPDEVKKLLPKITHVDTEKGYFDITDLGKLFIKACTN